MRKSLFYALFFLACLFCQTTEAKVKQKPVYVFGFATAFTDSLGYITDVQYIDSSYIDTKTKFLVGRNMYSVQLQQFLEANENCKHPVTSIFFATKKEKLEKKRLSMLRRYEKEKNLTLKNVSYRFHAEGKSYFDGVMDTPESLENGEKGEQHPGDNKKSKKNKS